MHAVWRVFVQPTLLREALHFIDALLAAPGVRQPQIGGEWPVLHKLCADKVLSADAVPGAWLAATVIHQGERLVSFDADF